MFIFHYSQFVHFFQKNTRLIFFLSYSVNKIMRQKKVGVALDAQPKSFLSCNIACNWKISVANTLAMGEHLSCNHASNWKNPSLQPYLKLEKILVATPLGTRKSLSCNHTCNWRKSGATTLAAGKNPGCNHTNN
jgi:hypothetical protein